MARPFPGGLSIPESAVPVRPALLAFALAAAAVIGCGGKSGPKTVAVKGTVLLNNKALADGEVFFLVTGQAPTTFPVKDGEFAGEAFVGTNKVEVRAYKAGPPLSTDETKTPTKVNYIPPAYSDDSKLTADVVAGGANTFKFEITAK